MKIEILVGPIASGKSTYTQKRANEGALVLNDDSIVTAIHGGIYQKYNKKLKPLYKHIGTSIITHAILANLDVVIDRTNLTKNARAKYISLAKSLDVPVSLVVFKKETPEIHAKRRADSDARGYDYNYWLDVAKYHNSIYEVPTVDEGVDEIIWM